MDLTTTAYFPPRAQKPWRLADFYAPSELRHFAFGRHALTAALRLLGLPKGRVLFPAFICRDLLASAAAAGFEPIFYDVDRNLGPILEPKNWPLADAVVAVDYFGFPQNLAPFQEYARATGATIVEDAAHALFSRDLAGTLLGRRAPLGILSPRKSLPVPNGGVLLVSDDKLAANLPAELAPELAGAIRARLKNTARPIFAAAGARATLAALTGFRALRGDPYGRDVSDPASETELPEPKSPCRQITGEISCADPAMEASRRRALWSFCLEIAKKAGLEPVFKSLPENVVPYAFAFRADDFHVARPHFARAGLNVLPWPALPAAVADAAPEHYRRVALAHFLW